VENSHRKRLRTCLKEYLIIKFHVICRLIYLIMRPGIILYNKGITF